TLSRLESVVDDLAVAYSVTPPAQLLSQIRLHLSYVAHLVDARKTLDEHRRLLVVGGWLSLLAATVHIDIEQYGAATAPRGAAAAAGPAGAPLPLRPRQVHGLHRHHPGVGRRSGCRELRPRDHSQAEGRRGRRQMAAPHRLRQPRPGARAAGDGPSR